MLRLTYGSFLNASTQEHVQTILQEVADLAVKNNPHCGITSCFFVHRSTRRAVQVLEGPARAVYHLWYEKISKDERHKYCTVLGMYTIESRTNNRAWMMAEELQADWIAEHGEDSKEILAFVQYWMQPMLPALPVLMAYNDRSIRSSGHCSPGALSQNVSPASPSSWEASHVHFGGRRNKHPNALCHACPPSGYVQSLPEEVAAPPPPAHQFNSAPQPLSSDGLMVETNEPTDMITATLLTTSIE
mmetsp:Transcript_73348/g.122529  ORF Transcript_73348/g.122529 Transcript_73348/m.122529 type:complete len:245 (-) Transcript_73348:426-1160(-)